MTDKSGVFQSYAAYYDLLYRDKDYKGEADYIDQLLQRMKVSGNQLLELGCGSGKHGGLLAKKGYRVHGIERSEEMIRLVQPTDGFSCERGDIRNFELGRTVDAVLSLFHVISYQVQNEDITAVFERVHKHLKNGGLFVFDIWYSPAVMKQGAEVRLKHIADEKIDMSRIAKPTIYPNENRIDVNYTVFIQDLIQNRYDVLKETHAMRHFSLPELDLWAACHGFERIGAEEFLSGQKPGEDTWGVCVILRKR